jgi:PAS domain S-box-containing protein
VPASPGPALSAVLPAPPGADLLLGAVLDAVDVAVLACDATGRLTLANDAALRWYGPGLDIGTDTGTHMGAAVSERPPTPDLYEADGAALLPPDRLPLRRTLDEGYLSGVEMTLAPVGLPSRLVRCEGRVLRDRADGVIGAVVVLTDITPSRALQRQLRAVRDALARAAQALAVSEERFQLVFASGPMAMCALDAGGEIRQVNSALRRLLDTTSGRLLGRPLASLVAPADRDRLAVALAGSSAGSVSGGRVEVRLQRANGERLRCSVGLARPAEGAVHLLLSFTALEGRRLAARNTPVGPTAPLPGISAPSSPVSSSPVSSMSGATIRSIPVRTAPHRSAPARTPGQPAVVRQRRRRPETRLAELVDTAVVEDRLSVLYQPLVDLRTGAIVGAEALLRMYDREHLVVQPDTFIPLAEDSGAIHELGEWVLLAGCQTAARWKRLLPPGREFGLGVNLSPRQLDDPLLRARVQGALADSGLDPAALVLELTERLLTTGTDHVRGQLDGLRGLGVHLAADDFGTGYCSLRYLLELPLDIIKIDRSWTVLLGEHSPAGRLADGLAALARTTGLVTIVEGVETERDRAAALAHGLVLAQGFLFAEPLTAGALEARLLGP